MQQLLHICSEHFDSKEKEEDKDKKDKKEKEKKESSADMGAHQVGKCGLGPVSLGQELALGEVPKALVGSELEESTPQQHPPAAPPSSPCAPGLRVGTGVVRTWVLGWVLPAWHSVPVSRRV